MHIIGLTGQPSSGKDTAADFFIQRGYAHISTSDLIRDKLRAMGKTTERANVSELFADLAENTLNGELRGPNARPVDTAVIAHWNDHASFYSWLLCQSFAPNHVCVVNPERVGLCGAYNWLDCKASYEINPTGPNQPVPKGTCIDPVQGGGCDSAIILPTVTQQFSCGTGLA